MTSQPSPSATPLPDVSIVKDHVEHLRTVHFSLVVVCFGLVVGSFLSRTPDVEEALSQLKKIENVVARWDEDWLRRYVRDSISIDRANLPRHRLPTRGDTFVAKHSAYGRLVLFRIWEPWWTIGGPSGNDIGKNAEFTPKARDDSQDFSLHDSVPAPQTLAEFARFWDTLRVLEAFVVNSLTENGIFLPPNNPRNWQLFKLEPWRGQYPRNSLELEVMRMVLLRSPPGRGKDSFSKGELGVVGQTEAVSRDGGPAVLGQHPADYALMNTLEQAEWYLIGREPWGLKFANTGPTVMVPVTVMKRTVNAQFDFARHHGLAADLGSFSHAFPRLHSTATDYADLRLSKIDTILEGLARRSGDRLELFGTKLPADELGRWGIPIILVLQLYLLVHLNALLSFASLVHNAPLPEIAWIGIYPQGIAQKLTDLSIGVFPVLATVYLLRRSVSFRSWEEAIWSFVLVISVGSIFFIAWRIHRLFKQFRGATKARGLSHEVSS